MYREGFASPMKPKHMMKPKHKEGFYGGGFGPSFNGAFSEGETDYRADAIQNRKDQRAYKTMS